MCVSFICATGSSPLDLHTNYKMGRKIPSKKHRGVKDPLKQQEKRLQSLKTKINAPPLDPDEQPVPRSLTELFSFQDGGVHARTRTEVQHKHKSTVTGKSVSKASKKIKKNENPISSMRRLPGESGRAFSLRINSAVRALHDPIDQCDLQDIEEEDVKGDHIAEHRQYRERKRRRAERAAQRAAGAAQGAAGAAAPALSAAQRRALKLEAKRMELDQEQRRREVVYERVRFGEVAHAPPALSAPRHALRPPAAGAPRPGARDLLLKQLLAGGGGGGGGGGDGDGDGADAAERLRQRAARAYRDLKASRAPRRR